MSEYEASADLVQGPESLTFGNKSEGFSHQELVMMAYRKAVESLCQEMKAGHKSETEDKNGKIVITYFPDTRKIAIQCITTLKRVLIADLIGTEFYTEIQRLQSEADTRRKFWLELQWKWWSSIKYSEREMHIQNKVVPTPDSFHPSLGFYNSYVDEQIDLYGKILEQLELCLADRRYFGKTKGGNIISA